MNFTTKMNELSIHSFAIPYLYHDTNKNQGKEEREKKEVIQPAKTHRAAPRLEDALAKRKNFFERVDFQTSVSNQGLVPSYDTFLFLYCFIQRRKWQSIEI